MHLTVDILPGRMVEVTEEVGDAPIVDVATDHDKLLLVVHLHKLLYEAVKWSSFYRMLVNWFFYFFKEPINWSSFAH